MQFWSAGVSKNQGMKFIRYSRIVTRRKEGFRLADEIIIAEGITRHCHSYDIPPTALFKIIKIIKVHPHVSLPLLDQFLEEFGREREP
jgi:hypothetical protein